MRTVLRDERAYGDGGEAAAVTDTKPDAEKALREAHRCLMIVAATPQKEMRSTLGTLNITEAHAAINRAVRAAWVNGREWGRRLDSDDEPDWLPKEGE